MRPALVIITYERPDALAAVLATVSRQTLAPAEIVIADDGSGPSTRKVVDDFIARTSVPTRVVSQPHSGFRVTRLRNLAIAATATEYLVFIDGDMLLHPEFIADHARICRRGFYTQGVRTHADAALTERLIADRVPRPAPVRGSRPSAISSSRKVGSSNAA